MYKCLRCMSVTLITLFATNISAVELIVYDHSYKPFMYVQNNKVDGVYPKLLKAAFEGIGVEYESIGLPWKRVLIEGKSGRAGIGGIYFNLLRHT
jgi:hypothetical protein